MSAPQPRAVILVRESNEDLAKGWSPDEYVRSCRRKAAELGAVVIEPPLIEVGKRNEWDSPKLRSAITLAEAGAYTYLISPDTARLAGDLGRLLWIKQKLAASGVELHYANISLATGAEGDLHEIMLGAFDQYERTKIGMRFQNGKRGKLAEGFPVCDTTEAYGTEKVHDARGRPIGYRPKEGQIEVLRRLVRDAQTQSLRSLASDLNHEGVATPSETGPWTGTMIYKLLINPLYGGDYQHGRRTMLPKRRADGTRWWKQVKNDPSHIKRLRIEPLVDPSELAKARAAMTARRTKGHARRPDEDDPFTLRGRLICEHCHGGLSTTGGAFRYYLCLRAYPSDKTVPRSERCPLPHLPAAAIEQYAWEGLSALLLDEARFEAELERAADGGEALARHAEQVVDLRSRIIKLGGRIANAARQLPDFDPEGETYRELMAVQQENERNKRALEASLAELERQRPVVISADDIERARALRGQLIDGITEAGEDAVAQRALYATLGTRGVVGLAQHEQAGVSLGRHRWAIRWRAPDDVINGDPHVQRCETPLIITPSDLTVRRASPYQGRQDAAS